MEEIKSKLALLREKLVKNPGDLSANEKKQYLDFLRVVVQEAGAMEKDLKHSVGSSADGDDDASRVLKMRGTFTRDPHGGGLILPAVQDLNEQLAGIGRQNSSLGVLSSFTVTDVFSEKNFNYIQQPNRCPNHLLQEEEVFLKFGSSKQASYILGLSHGLRLDIYPSRGYYSTSTYHFSLPTQNAATRAVYRTIGELLVRLKRVNEELKQLGAVPGRGGVPVLPENFVQTDEFDETVRALQESIQAIGGSSREDLHSYLVSRCKVDKRKRQEILDSLVDERIDVLLKLCSYNPDETPFSFDRGFFA